MKYNVGDVVEVVGASGGATGAIGKIGKILPYDRTVRHGLSSGIKIEIGVGEIWGLGIKGKIRTHKLINYKS